MLPVVPDKATLKKSLFPVQRVARMMASREAGNFLFLDQKSFCIERVLKILSGGGGERSLKHENGLPKGSP